MNASKGLIQFLFFISFVISGSCFSQPPSYCSTNRFTDVAIFDSSDVRIDSNIVYAVSKNYFSGVNDTLIMDIYYPDTTADTMSARPFIMLIHGGSFIAGSIHDMDYQCMEFARRGFVIATIHYRLGWDCSGTDFLSICVLCGNLGANIKTATYEAAQDGRAAMRYVDAMHEQYKIDRNNYFIGGTSAGSITAMHTAFWDQQEADAFCPWATNGICTSMNLVPLSVNHCSFPEYELVHRASCFIRSVLCDSCQTSYNNTPYVLQRCSSTSGIEEINSLYSISFFPNPASEKLQLDGFKIDEECVVLLFDLSGRIIFEEKIKNEAEHSFQLDEIASGSYFLKINSGQENRVEKILIIPKK